jgi:predicted DNA binding CopG/RHH family protein
MPDPLVKLTIRVPKSLLQEAKIHAVKRDLTLQDVVTQALNRLLHAKGGR